MKNLLVILLLSFTIACCKNDSFKNDALSVGEILKSAVKLEDFKESEATLTDKNKKVIRVYSNKKKSIQFLIKKQKELHTLYWNIRQYADLSDSVNFFNEKVICININQLLYMLSAKQFESNLVNNLNYNFQLLQKVDDWVINDFYAKIEVPDDYRKEWIAGKKTKKITEIHESILFISEHMQ